MQWLLKRFQVSGVREDSIQEIIKVSISNDVTSDLKDESSNTFSISGHEISKSESDYVSENMDDAEYANLTAAEKKNFLTGMTLSRNTGENTVSHTSLI